MIWSRFMLLVVVYACVAVAQTRATAVELHERLLWHANRKEFIDVPNPCAAFSSSKKWITVQRRLDGTEDFKRKWDDYVEGFGSVYGEFWIGLEALHHVTSKHKSKLLVVLEDLEGIFKCAAYKNFYVASRVNKYKLTVSGYTGNAGDSLTPHNGQSFSTIDKDNDVHSSNCAAVYKGAWWYKSCHESNLNGQYLNGTHKSFADGVNWKRWKGYHYSLKSVELMVAPEA